MAFYGVPEQTRRPFIPLPALLPEIYTRLLNVSRRRKVLLAGGERCRLSDSREEVQLPL